ncbi:hypothetical protein BC831DRAFT_481011 [Entophlyctis helioformis]|nr:hypothetical protein BC831DRAFT_481011 [Entophlyctis helioformis]
MADAAGDDGERDTLAPLPDAASGANAAASSSGIAADASAGAPSQAPGAGQPHSKPERKQSTVVGMQDHGPPRMTSSEGNSGNSTSGNDPSLGGIGGGAPGMSHKERIAANRRIIAEDPEWNLAPIERLSDLCVKMIVANFEKKPILKGIPEKYRDRVIASVSIDIPLTIAAPLIPDESYWQRRSKVRFKLANVQEHGGSWKRLFFELYLRDRIETFVPKKEGGEKQLAELAAELRLGAPFVECIHLRQLKPSQTSVEPTDGDGGKDPTAGGMPVMSLKEVIAKSSDVHPDHVDLSLVLDQLVYLRELSIYYGVKDCGINFSWTYFGMTLNDSLKLSSSLGKCMLRRLTIQASAIDDDRCRLLCHALLSNTHLTFLDLSHNKIADSGARGIAKVIATPTVLLSDLRLSNNKIGQAGVQSIGKALSLNSNLRHLDLRLNHLGDPGGHTICAALTRNKHLQDVDLSGNGLGSKTVSALCALLRKNGAALVGLDLSCNKLGNYGHTVAMEAAAAAAAAATGVASSAAAPAAGVSPQREANLFGANHGNIDGDLAGKMIFEAISQNKYVTKLDLRMSDLSPEYLVAIQGIINENGMI